MEEENIDYKKVEYVKSKMPNDDILFDMAETFKVFGDSTRIKIISALSTSIILFNIIATPPTPPGTILVEFKKTL